MIPKAMVQPGNHHPGPTILQRILEGISKTTYLRLKLIRGRTNICRGIDLRDEVHRKCYVVVVPDKMEIPLDAVYSGVTNVDSVDEAPCIEKP